MQEIKAQRTGILFQTEDIQQQCSEIFETLSILKTKLQDVSKPDSPQGEVGSAYKTEESSALSISLKDISKDLRSIKQIIAEMGNGLDL